MQLMDFGKVIRGKAQVTLRKAIRHDKPTTITQETRLTHNAVTHTFVIIVRIQRRRTTYLANIFLTYYNLALSVGEPCKLFESIVV